MKRFIYLAAAAVFGLSACCGSKNTSKAKAAPVILKDTYWKLIELNGQPVSDASDRKEIYVMFNTKENHVGGNGGCNGFGGTYTLDPNGFNIKFSPLIRTQMACPGLDIENQFMQVLEKTDSYYVRNDTLQLNRARMAPLAIFKAVKGKEGSTP